MMDVFNSSTLEGEAGQSLWVRGWSGLYGVILANQDTVSKK